MVMQSDLKNLILDFEIQVCDRRSWDGHLVIVKNRSQDCLIAFLSV